jgi:hypothetical protein
MPKNCFLHGKCQKKTKTTINNKLTTMCPRACADEQHNRGMVRQIRARKTKVRTRDRNRGSMSEDDTIPKEEQRRTSTGPHQ